MRRIIVLLLVVAMAVSGCATFWTKAEETICNPPAVVVDGAKLAAPIIKIAIGMLIEGSQEYLDAIDSAAAVDSILRTGCVAAGSLNKLIAFLQSSIFKSAEVAAQTKAMGKMKAAPKAVSVQPFQDWRDKK
jgi:hypothetical protein